MRSTVRASVSTESVHAVPVRESTQRKLSRSACAAVAVAPTTTASTIAPAALMTRTSPFRALCRGGKEKLIARGSSACARHHASAGESRHEARRRPQHRARRPQRARHVRSARCRHGARGARPFRPDEALHAADLCRCADRRARGHRAGAAGGQLDDPRGGGAVPQGRRAGGRVKGRVIDAGCRDVKALTQMGFPVWSRAISAKGTVKSTLGAVNVPVVCAGVNVEPGDAVVADDDGVVVVPRRLAVEVAQKAQKRADDEVEKRRRWEAGESSLDMYNMREALAKAGLRYVDRPEDV